MRRSLLVSGLIAATLAAVRVEQQPAQTPTQIFRAGTDYVRVDVVVTDKDDQPITNLTKDDFQITEHERPQTIDDFQFISVPLVPRASRQNEPPGPAADVTSNAPPSVQSRLFVMVIDDLHILEQDLIHTKDVMTEFIKVLTPDDEAAIVFTGHSNLSQNFTRDPSLLLKTTDRLREALGFGLDALGHSTPSSVLADNKREMLRYARSADFVLKNVVMSLAGSGHSRRAVVYVTAGSVVPTTPPATDLPFTDFDELREVYDVARRSDVPIYTIDPRGQVVPEDAVRGGIGNIGVLTQGSTSGSNPGVAQRSTIVANLTRQRDRLAEAAVNTGGRAFTDQSNLTHAVDDIVADNGSYYLLGYYPNPFAADGKFHEFSVKVNRPGVRVRGRPGYVASSLQPATTDATTVLNATMSAGVNVSALYLRAFAMPVASGTKGSRTLVTVEVIYPPRPGESGRIDDELQVRVLALDPDAKIKASSGGTLRFNGAVPNTQTATVLINDVVDLPPQPLTLRVGVASGALGKAGSVQLSVDVPNFSDDKLHLSGIALGLNGVSPSALNANAIESLVPFQPVATRTFAPTDTLRVFGRVFWRSKDPAVVTTRIKDVPASLTQPALAMSPSPKGGQTGAFDAVVPLAGLTPGRYVLEVTVQLPGGKPIMREVPFAIQ